MSRAVEADGDSQLHSDRRLSEGFVRTSNESLRSRAHYTARLNPEQALIVCKHDSPTAQKFEFKTVLLLINQTDSVWCILTRDSYVEISQIYSLLAKIHSKHIFQEYNFHIENIFYFNFKKSKCITQCTRGKRISNLKTHFVLSCFNYGS